MIKDLLLKMANDDVSIGPELQKIYASLFNTAFPNETPPIIFDGTKFTTTPDDLMASIDLIEKQLKAHPPKVKGSMDERIENMVKIFATSRNSRI